MKVRFWLIIIVADEPQMKLTLLQLATVRLFLPKSELTSIISSSYHGNSCNHYTNGLFSVLPIATKINDKFHTQIDTEFHWSIWTIWSSCGKGILIWLGFLTGGISVY